MTNPRCPLCDAATDPSAAVCAACGAGLPAAGVDHASPRRASGRGRRLALTVMAISVLIVVAVGAVVLRASSAVGSLQAVSSPPPSVARSALDATGTGEIDTAPAREMSADDHRGPDAAPDWWDQLGRTLAAIPETVNGVAVAAGAQTATLEPMTVLLLGVDARPGQAIDVGVRADAIAVLRLEPDVRACRLLAIPRDTRTELPGYGQSKINHALALGGIPYQIEVVEQFLGLEIDRYALADVRGFAGVIDRIGGVTVAVSEQFTAGAFVFEPGARRLDGAAALAYVRFRDGPDGDFGRISRQQQVLRAVASRASGLDLPRLARELLPAIEDHVRTDLSPLEIGSLVVRYQAGCGTTGLEVDTLRGSTASFADPLVGQELSFVVVDDAEISAKVAALLGAGD